MVSGIDVAEVCEGDGCSSRCRKRRLPCCFALVFPKAPFVAYVSPRPTLIIMRMFGLTVVVFTSDRTSHEFAANARHSTGGDIGYYALGGGTSPFRPQKWRVCRSALSGSRRRLGISGIAAAALR